MHIENYSLENMCEVLDISKRTYYKYRAAEDKDYYDYLLIKEIFDESKGTYGYRRICEGLIDKYGVEYSTYKQPTPEDSAIATIIVLNESAKKAKTKAVQDGIEMANDRIYYSKRVPTVKGNFIDKPMYIKNNVTEQDAMLYIYNGATSRLTRGDATPAIRLYNVNVKKYQKLLQKVYCYSIMQKKR